jgi:pantoate--beta-alanine ligase
VIVTGEINEVRAARSAANTLTWGLVPTMGYLHEGHLALVRRARSENDRVAVTIYVNPAQFAPTEDLSTYPRNLERDLDLLRPLGVDLIFTPTDAVMYPAGYQTYINVEQLARMLEGSSRPIHFRGVATVVAKLFNILQPTRAYFGQKDAQQTVVIRRMAADLNFNLEVIVCPTVREADGLAMSSRNVYLTPEQRAAAPVLYRALSAARDAYLSGEQNGDALRDILRNTIAAEQLARIDYVSAADLHTLVEVDRVAGNAVLFSLAVFFGKTRLIDNIPVSL